MKKFITLASAGLLLFSLQGARAQREVEPPAVPPMLEGQKPLAQPETREPAAPKPAVEGKAKTKAKTRADKKAPKKAEAKKSRPARNLQQSSRRKARKTKRKNHRKQLPSSRLALKKVKYCKAHIFFSQGG